MEFSFEILALLFMVALIASTIDTLAGGGGLFTIPALLLAGLPPIMALGTNKFQAFVGTATASIMMIQKKQVDFKSVKLLALSAFVGSCVGTIFIQFIDVSVLNFIIPITLFFIGLYFLFLPNPKNMISEARISQKLYSSVIVPVIGFYDGSFGPGTGSFFSLSAIALRGFDIIKATALAKILNFSTNIASCLLFLYYGKVVFSIGFVMMIGQVLGAYMGSHFLLKINPNHLRILVVIMCFLMLLKYFLS